MDVGNDEGELRARMPAFRRTLWIGVVEVNRDGIIRWCLRVSKWEEEYPPVQADRLIAWKAVSDEEQAPSVSTTLEFGAGDLLVQFFPVVDSPCVHLEFFHVVAKVRHILGGKRVICELSHERAPRG